MTEPLRILPPPEIPEWMEERAEQLENIRREREAWTGRTGGWASLDEAVQSLVDMDWRPRHRKPRPHAEKLAYADHLRQNMTAAELSLWTYLSGFELDFEAQVVVGGWIVDFYSATLGLAIEVDGSAHTPAHRVAQDAERERSLNDRGVRVVRLTNAEVMAHRYDRLLRAIAGDVDA